MFGLSAGASVLIACRSNLVIRRGLNVGRIVHNELLEYVYRAPINLYFDITPIGKLLNRFSKDMAVIDEQIYYNFNGFLFNMWQAVYALIVASIAVPYIVAAIGLFAIVMFCLFTYAMNGYRDCYRIESVTMSPLLSYFQETFNGNSVIRAYNRSEGFIDYSHTLINKITLANQITSAVYCWYTLRLDLMTGFVLTCGCAGVIVLRSEVSPVLLTLML